MDGGDAGEKLREALAATGDWTIEILKRSDAAQGFELVPRRRGVERTCPAEPQPPPRQSLRDNHRLRMANLRLRPTHDPQNDKVYNARYRVLGQTLDRSAMRGHRFGARHFIPSVKDHTAGRIADQPGMHRDDRDLVAHL